MGSTPLNHETTSEWMSVKSGLYIFVGVTFIFSPFLNIYLFWYGQCACIADMWRSQDNLTDSVLSFQYLGLRDQT